MTTKMRRQVTIADLPLDVILRIFSLLLPDTSLSSRTLRECSDVFSLVLTCKRFHSLLNGIFYKQSKASSSFSSANFIYPCSSSTSLSSLIDISSSIHIHHKNLLLLPFIWNSSLRSIHLPANIPIRVLQSFLFQASKHCISTEELTFKDNPHLNHAKILTHDSFHHLRTCAVLTVSHSFLRFISSPKTLPSLANFSLTVTDFSTLRLLSTALRQRCTTKSSLEKLHVHLAVPSMATYRGRVEWKHIFKFVIEVVQNFNGLKSLVIESSLKMKIMMDITKRHVQNMHNEEELFINEENKSNLILELDSLVLKSRQVADRKLQLPSSISLNTLLRAVVRGNFVQFVRSELERHKLRATIVLDAKNSFYDFTFENFDERKIETYKNTISKFMNNVKKINFEDNLVKSPYCTKTKTSNFMKLAIWSVSALSNIQHLSISISCLMDCNQDQIGDFIQVCSELKTLTFTFKDCNPGNSWNNEQIENYFNCLLILLKNTKKHCLKLEKVVLQDVTEKYNKVELGKTDKKSKLKEKRVLIMHEIFELERKMTSIDLDSIKFQV